MSKGLGHYTSTSAWDGNVGVCGHNRGAKYVIGAIKDLEIGDTITYTTTLGTRTYTVETVATISSTDWSYLSATSDNRITIGPLSRAWRGKLIRKRCGKSPSMSATGLPMTPEMMYLYAHCKPFYVRKPICRELPMCRRSPR